MKKHWPHGFGFVISIFVAVASSAQITLYPDPSPKLSVTGHGEVVAAPDMAVVSLGVYVLDKDLRKGKATSDVSVKRLLQVALALGAKGDDVVSSNLSIDPSYSEGKTREFLGYEISRSVEVTLRDLGKLDELVDQAIQSGANREFSVSLKSSQEAEFQRQAVALAVEDAKAQAARLASGFGVKLGTVRSISPGGERGTTTYSASAAAISYGRGTFAPGTIRFHADVSASFLLEP